MENKTITTIDNLELELDAISGQMDTELREHLHSDLSPCAPQEFYDAYVGAHFERFNEDFVIDNLGLELTQSLNGYGVLFGL